MANIKDFLNTILTGRYGRDVRQAIHDGIQQCYYDGKAGEIDLQARQDIEKVVRAVDVLDAKLLTAEAEIDAVSDEVDAVENKLTAYPYTVVKLMTEEAIDNYYDTVGENLGTTDTHYTRVIQHGVSHSVLKGGNYFLEGYRANNNFEWQKITLYSVDGETRKFERSKINAVWTEWVSTSYRADIDAIKYPAKLFDINSNSYSAGDYIGGDINMSLYSGFIIKYSSRKGGYYKTSIFTGVNKADYQWLDYVDGNGDVYCAGVQVRPTGGLFIETVGDNKPFIIALYGIPA